jgi:predicted nucleic acid-binding protein
MVADPMHVYLGSLPSPVARDSRGAFGRVLGSKQVTDAYLLMLARRNHAVFLTFDTKLQGLAGLETRVKVLT